ncbi:MAG: insulinase family protein [Deltaproteobacteria bacterium]|nr:insulinase family protein [Deltaproteobacteria bacterium]
MYHKTVLHNGTRIVTEKLEHSRALSLGIWVSVGSRNETEKESGISHFIEHMLFKGTPTRDSLQIAKELDAVGGFSNAFTGKEYTCFHAKVLDKHFPILADILSDIFLHSMFDPKDINREKQVVQQEIRMVDDSPEEYIHDLFHALFWSDHSLGRSILGTDQTVSGITRKRLLRHLQRFYTPERIIITAAGNMDHESVVSFFEPLFTALEPSQDRISNHPPLIHPGVLGVYRDLEQVHICLGGQGPHLLSELRFVSAVFNTILGGNMSSRLFQEVREKRGLAYSIYSFLSEYIDTGMMGVCVGTDAPHVNNVLKIINTEIKKIQRGDLTKADLMGAREHLIGAVLLSAENTDARMMRLAKNEYVFGRYITYEEVVEKLEKVTIDEVVNCANEIFCTNRVSLATLGPMKQKKVDLDCLQFD